MCSSLVGRGEWVLANHDGLHVSTRLQPFICSFHVLRILFVQLFADWRLHVLLYATCTTRGCALILTLILLAMMSDVAGYVAYTFYQELKQLAATIIQNIQNRPAAPGGGAQQQSQPSMGGMFGGFGASQPAAGKRWAEVHLRMKAVRTCGCVCGSSSSRRRYHGSCAD